MVANKLSDEAISLIFDLQMTRDEIESYRALLHEIKHQKVRLQKLKDQGNDSEVVHALIKIISNSIIKSEKLVLKIEIFIDTIEDSRIRELIRMRYIDDMTWKDVAGTFFIAERHARRLVSDFFEDKYKCGCNCNRKIHQF